jgi:hypothetical protein
VLQKAKLNPSGPRLFDPSLAFTTASISSIENGAIKKALLASDNAENSTPSRVGLFHPSL